MDCKITTASEKIFTHIILYYVSRLHAVMQSFKIKNKLAANRDFGMKSNKAALAMNDMSNLSVSET